MANRSKVENTLRQTLALFMTGGTEEDRAEARRLLSRLDAGDDTRPDLETATTTEAHDNEPR